MVSKEEACNGEEDQDLWQGGVAALALAKMVAVALANVLDA